MKIERVMYIVPAVKREYKKDMKNKVGAPPIGVGLLSSFLKLHGYVVELIDMFVEDYSPSEIKQRISDFNPDVVAISASFTESISVAMNIAGMVKRNFKAIVIAGGVHTTFLPEEVLSQNVDYVILNEGESTTIKLLEYLKADCKKEKLASLHSVGYKDEKGNMHINRINEPLEDLDSLPIYDFRGFKMERYATPLALITSRGCPGDCVYCASRAMFGKRYRLRSAESIISEAYVLYQYARGSSSILRNYMAIYDDTFTAQRVRLKKFCKYMIQTGLSKRVAWKCESRIDILNEEILVQMKECGCIAIHVGLESTSQEVINSLNKHIKVEKMEEVLALMAKHQIEPLCSFIIGNHSDTKETLTATIDFIERIQKKYGAYVAVSPNTPLPGTELYNNPEKYGITIKSNAWTDYSLLKVIIDTSNLTQDEIRNFYAKASEVISNRED
ncbi:MAG: cobalamin-dependent protein [Lachnospiraceae bacterium]|nr:cobalamin-dependent protein [Lachnospiraceae bacterium]